MVQKFHPELNKVYFINSYTLYLIKSGTGTIQVDFQNYADWQDKVIYLSKGQYLKFLSDDFEVLSITFPDLETFNSPDFRVLFKHLISLGYIDLGDCKECQRFLSNSIFSEDLDRILDISKDQWFWQNPFKAQKEEYHIIFDLKDVIDEDYCKTINSSQLSSSLNSRGYNVNQLVKHKLGISVSNMLVNKRALESKKAIAFTDNSIQEIAYQTGFKDPGYFNRFFKTTTGQTPVEFRNNFDFENRDTFVQNILELLKTHHRREHQLNFYADKMNMSVQTLSKKVKDRLNVSIGQLIRNEIITTAKELLRKDLLTVKEAAWRLGFEEPNHFSAFFKHQVGKTPSDFRQQ